MANASKAKGTRGEQEVMSILQGVVNEEYERVGRTPPELSRSPHGRDVVGLPWLAPEVKRHEPPTLDAKGKRLGELFPAQVASFWAQCKDQATRDGGNREAVLFVRMNNRPWLVRMFGYLHLPAAVSTCPKCEGKGKVLQKSYAIGSQHVELTCPECKGVGRLEVKPATRVRCPVDITMEAFVAWFRLRLRQDLGSVPAVKVG